MLHTRIQILKAYLTSLPPSYLTDPSKQDSTPTEANSVSVPPAIDHSVLRSIQALVNRLPLLVPADGEAFEQESLAEKSDVSLVALLGDLTRGTKNVREMGRKFGIVNSAKQRRPGRSFGLAYENTEEQYDQMISMEQPYE